MQKKLCGSLFAEPGARCKRNVVNGEGSGTNGPSPSRSQVQQFVVPLARQTGFNPNLAMARVNFDLARAALTYLLRRCTDRQVIGKPLQLPPALDLWSLRLGRDRAWAALQSLEEGVLCCMYHSTVQYQYPAAGTFE
jgi:hypothetical protein